MDIEDLSKTGRKAAGMYESIGWGLGPVGVGLAAFSDELMNIPKSFLGLSAGAQKREWIKENLPLHYPSEAEAATMTRGGLRIMKSPGESFITYQGEIYPLTNGKTITEPPTEIPQNPEGVMGLDQWAELEQYDAAERQVAQQAEQIAADQVQAEDEQLYEAQQQSQSDLGRFLMWGGLAFLAYKLLSKN